MTALGRYGCQRFAHSDVVQADGRPLPYSRSDSERSLASDSVSAGLTR